MLKSYGGYTWSSQDPPAINPESHRILGLTALGVLGAAGAYGATRDLKNGYRPLDYIAAATRLAGNLSPFQLGNTFRIPEILSPWLSDKYRAADVPGFGVWEKDFLKSDSTYDWLKYTTGLTDEQLRSKGVTRGMLGAEEAVASRLEWKASGGARGLLEAVLPSGERHLLSKDVSLLAANEETLNVLTDRQGLNRYAAGVFAAADMYIKPGFEETDVFASKAFSVDGQEIKARQGSAFIPVPSVYGNISSPEDLLRRSVLPRGVPAFEMNRYNVLITDVVEQFTGDVGKRFFTDVLGLGTAIKPGPASHMFTRYGLAAAGVGAVVMANQQLDWFRRRGTTGQVVASAAVSAGAAHVIKRMGASSKQAFMAGAASFFGQMVLPGFDKGLVEGISTIGVNLDIMRGNAINPFGYYRRTLEGFAPGISDWKTGALIGVAATAAANLTLPGMNSRLNVKLAKALGTRLPGVDPYTIDHIVAQNQGLRDIFYQNVGQELKYTPDQTRGFLRRKALLAEYQSQGTDPLARTRELNQLWSRSEEQFRTMRKNNPLNLQLMGYLSDIAQTHQGGGMNAVLREAKGFVAEAYMNFLGADLSHNRTLMQQARDMGFGRFGPTTRVGRLGSIGLAAFLGHQLLTGGLLGSMESSDELKEIYSGRKMVEMRKSRFWEGGGTPYEGGDTSYYRPHAYALMMNRVREKGIWGENEDEISPLRKFFIKNFTYDLEKQNYWSRPYPMTSAAFSDVPIIGGVLGASIGQLIKPPKLMHTGEWMREGPDGQTEFASVFRGAFIEPAFSLGAVGQGRPANPFAPNILHSNLVHQFQELEGMTGWAKSVMTKGLFGSENWASDQARLATAGEMTSWANQFWEAEIGGGLFTNEFIRRVFPRKQSEIKQYNPIMNSMPSWLPDKFHYGDPYRAVQWGEARLPGAGFAALHPELQGVDAEAYPLLYKYQILADVAPLTPEFFRAQKQIYTRRQAGELTQREIDWIDRIDANRMRVVNKRTFDEVTPGAITLPGSGIARSIWGAGGNLMRDLAAPGEYMIPMGLRPFQKLTGGRRDALESYEYERLYGTPLAFWDQPVRDWFRPSFYSAMHLLGYEGKPQWRREADATNEYFDKLEFIKYMQLAQSSAEMGDGRAAAQYRWQASQTRVGVNPMGSPLSIYWSLPAEDRAYFNAFAQTKDEAERERILEMVPSDQANLYRALWSRIESGDPSLYNTGTVIDSGYMRSQLANVSQEMSSYPMPSPDWIGWHGDVDMSDISVRYVDRIGADVHDYGLWESDLRKSQGQPFLEGSEDFIFAQGGLRFSNMRSEVYNMLGTQFRPPSLSYSVMPGTNPYAHITYNDSRDGAISNAVQGYINGY